MLVPQYFYGWLRWNLVLVTFVLLFLFALLCICFVLISFICTSSDNNCDNYSFMATMVNSGHVWTIFVLLKAV